MDIHDIINLGFGALFAIIGWFLRTLHQAHNELINSDKALAEKVYSIELLVAGTYVKRDDFAQLSSALFNKLDKIYDKLDCKVDK